MIGLNLYSVKNLAEAPTAYVQTREDSDHLKPAGEPVKPETAAVQQELFR
jgi:hypothetical protein